MSDMPDSMVPMTGCERVQWELACLEPGEAPRAETNEHVASCSECRAIAAELSGNREALASLNEGSVNAVSTPRELLPEVRAELDRQLDAELAQVSLETSSASASQPWGWVAAAAMVVAVSTAAWQFSRGPSENVEEQEVVASVAPVTEPESAPGPSNAPSSESVGGNQLAEVVAPELVAPPVPTPAAIVPTQQPAQVAEAPQVAATIPGEAVLAVADLPVLELQDFAPEEFRLPEFEPTLAEPETSKEAQMQTTMVKLLTDDPNVVIYWLIESEAETGSAAKKQL